jgi:hypothetical protein
MKEVPLMRTWFIGRTLILALHLLFVAAAVVGMVALPREFPALTLPVALAFGIYGWAAAKAAPDALFFTRGAMTWVFGAIVIDVAAGTGLLVGLGMLTGGSFGVLLLAYAWALLGGLLCFIVWPIAWAVGSNRER